MERRPEEETVFTYTKPKECACPMQALIQQCVPYDMEKEKCQAYTIECGLCGRIHASWTRAEGHKKH